MKLGMILNVASKQVESNSYSKEVLGFGGAIRAILEEFEGKMGCIFPFSHSAVSLITLMWPTKGHSE